MKVNDVAELLDLSPNTVRKLTVQGAIPGVVFENRKRRIYRYDSKAIERFLRNGNMLADERKSPELNLDWLKEHGKETAES